MVDITVIGGGPAGTSAAIRLAQSGRRVRLYEKSHFPRPKLCGGFLSADGLADLEALGVLTAVRRAGAFPLYRTVIASRRGTVIASELPDEALSVSRDVLDDILMREAQAQGVDVHWGEDGFRSSVTSGCTVIAAGRQAAERMLGSKAKRTPWYASPPDPYFGIQAAFRDVQGITDQVELDLIESGYVGLARLQNDTVNVCTLTTQETLKRWGPSLDCVMAHFMDENPVLRSHLEGASRVGSWMSVGPVKLGVRQLAHDQTFFIGDAACVVDPFAGEGISIGLYSSRLLVQALDQNRLAPAKAYAAYWRQAFLPALRWNALMRMTYRFRLFREPMLHALKGFPEGLTWLTELTRHRLVEGVS